MIERKAGRIVNLASVAAYTAHTDLWYGVTKAGVVSFTRSFASCLGPHGIQAIRWLALDAPPILNGAVIDITDGCFLR